MRVAAQKKEAPRREPEDLDKKLGCENQQLHSKPEARRQEARANLERFTDQLAVMAHWCEQLKAELNDVYVLLDSERFDSLTRRTRLFCEAADALCDMLGGRK